MAPPRETRNQPESPPRCQSAVECRVGKAGVSFAKQFLFSIQLRLAFKSNSPQLGQRDKPTFPLSPVGIPAVWLKQIRIRFIAAQTQSGCDVQRHLMPA